MFLGGLRAPQGPRYRPGDVVMFIAVPDYCRRKQWRSAAWRRHALTLGSCLDGTYRVVDVGEDGRTELDVLGTASRFDRRLTGCTMSIEPEYLELVLGERGRVRSCS